MTEEERFLDFATVREMLYDAQDRRGSLKYCLLYTSDAAEKRIV